MKRSLLLVLVLASAFHTADAQFNRGRFLAGGSLGFSSQKTNDISNRSFSFQPNVGFFVVDNLAIGADLSISVFSFEDGQTQSFSKTQSFSFDPFVRYYLKPGIFGEGSVGFGKGKIESDQIGSSGDYSLFNWSLGVGYAWFLNDHVALEPVIRYENSKFEGRDFSTSGLALQIGLQVYLGKR